MAGDNTQPWSQYSVLVVDDEPGMVSFLQRALSSRCGMVDCAASVEAARPLTQRNLLRPDRARHCPAWLLRHRLAA